MIQIIIRVNAGFVRLLNLFIGDEANLSLSRTVVINWYVIPRYKLSGDWGEGDAATPKLDDDSHKARGPLRDLSIIDG